MIVEVRRRWDRIGECLIDVIAEIDRSNCCVHSMDIAKVEHNGWRVEHLLERFGVDVNGI